MQGDPSLRSVDSLGSKILTERGNRVRLLKTLRRNFFMIHQLPPLNFLDITAKTFVHRLPPTRNETSECVFPGILMLPPER